MLLILLLLLLLFWGVGWRAPRYYPDYPRRYSWYPFWGSGSHVLLAILLILGILWLLGILRL